MTNEEAIEILQEEHDWVQEPCYVINAIKKAIKALRFVYDRDPLTLEQLREMDGQPVWVKLIGKTAIRCDGWCEIKIADKDIADGFVYLWWPGSEVEDITLIDDYGKTWLAYAYQPAHIDREAFGCQFCNAENHCANCLYDNLPGQIEPCRSCEAHGNWETASRFCPHCGRPMTEEAWAELEKRLRG